MSIELVRVDDRLIHGQVVIGWTRSRGINTILVADDATSKSKMQCQLMKMATPPGVTPVFFTVEETASKILDGTYDNKKVMILTKSCYQIADLIEKGVNITEINLGNLRSGEGKVAIANMVYASKDEIRVWKELSSKGIKLYAQSIPSNPSTNINEALQKF
ncbi:MAG: PTS system mannose/fructose/N-acetylgalactosamine-transporter subunit IIB [Erysipelotrichaceae bacterium]|jgi:mannose/fructose/N-acetylgalactosamine-specific phosphotransferase system component IIB